MPLLLQNRVLETCTSPGTGSVTLLGASTGYQSFNTAYSATSSTVYYTIADQSGANWEVGVGTFTPTATLSRDTVLSSSAGGTTKVNFSSGTQNVWVDYPSEKAVIVNDVGDVLLNQSYDQGTGVLQVTGQSTFNGAVTDKSLNLQGGNNLVLNSATLVTQNITVTANTYTLSMTGTGTITLSGTSSGTLVGTGASQVVSKTFTPTAGTLTLTPTGSCTTVQLELGSVFSGYTATTGTAVTTTNNISVPSGQVLNSNGTQALPSYSFGSSSGSGMAWDGTNLTFSTAGILKGYFNLYGLTIPTNYSIYLPANGYLQWNNGDLYLSRDAANTLAQRNSTNAQTFRLYNTYTSSTSYENLQIDWTTTANTATISTQAGSGGGTVRNLAIGQDLYVNTVRVGLGGGSVSSNTAVGNLVLTGSTTGAFNTGVGQAALRNITSGSNNSGYGVGALNNTNIGGSNTAFGVSTLGQNTSGGNNSAFGVNASLYNYNANNNLGIGNSALYNNTTASNLVAVGVSALFSNTTNVATLGAITGGSSYTNGTYTGVVMTLSSGSTAITYPTATIVVAGGVVTTVTLTSNGVGFKDTTTVLTAPAASIGGTGSGFSVPVATLQSGTGNVAVGYQAGFTASVATNNTYNGYQAGYGITTGSNSVFMGYGSGNTTTITTTGSQLVYIGSGSRGSAATNQNEIAIGYNAVGLGSNTTVIGNSSTTLTKTFGVHQATTYTVATLPSASTSGVGARAFVTDALAPVFGATVVTGGAVATPVYSDSVNWKVG